MAFAKIEGAKKKRFNFDLKLCKPTFVSACNRGRSEPDSG